MKKIIFAVVIVAIAVGYFVLRDNSPVDKTETPTVKKGGGFRPDPKGATFMFDDEAITLFDGRNERTMPTGSAFVEETVLLDKFAYGDINADDKEDTVLFLARYGAGSGTFIYLAAFVSGPVTYRGSKVLFIGDRIALQSVAVNGEVVTVEYLDREIDEALAAEPTVKVSKHFAYRAGEFQEWK